MLDNSTYQQGKQFLCNNGKYYYVENGISKFLKSADIKLVVLTKKKEPLLESMSGKVDIQQLTKNNILIKKTKTGYIAYVLHSVEVNSFDVLLLPNFKVLSAVLCYYQINNLLENNMVIDVINNNTEQDIKKISFALGMLLSKESFKQYCVQSKAIGKKEEKLFVNLNNIANHSGLPYNFVNYAFEEYQSQIDFEDLFKQQLSLIQKKEKQYRTRKSVNQQTENFFTDALALTAEIGLGVFGTDYILVSI